PGVEEALDLAMSDLKRVQAEDGSFGYRKPGDHAYSLTGLGVLCSCLWKHVTDPGVQHGIDYILKQSDKIYPIKYQSKSADLYAWFYNTQACFMFGGKVWTKWNGLFRQEIASHQEPDGSWPTVGGINPGGMLQQKKDGAGPQYRTALCVLMLEVFYRYRPNSFQ